MRFVNADTAFKLKQFSAYNAPYSNLSRSFLYRSA